MLRWTAGTKARADRASRQHGYPGGSARLLACRFFHPRPSDVASPPTAPGTGATAAAASRSSAYADTARDLSSLALTPSAAVLDDAIADTAVGTRSPVLGAVIGRAAPASAESLSAVVQTSSSAVTECAPKVMAEGDCERRNTLKSAAADGSSLCRAPALWDHGSAAPPSPSSPLPSPPLDVVANRCGDPSEHPPSASSPSCSEVILAKHQPPHQPSPPLPGRSTCSQQTVQPPLLPSELYAPSAVHVKRLLEALEAKAAPQRARRCALGRPSPQQRAWRQPRKRLRAGGELRDSSCDTDAAMGSSEEEMADTYAKVQQQRQRQLREKHAGGERRGPNCSVDGFVESIVPHRHQTAQRREQRQQRRSRLSAAEQSVDCIAVQLPLQRAKDAPASAKAQATVVSSPRAYPKAQSSLPATAEKHRHAALACADRLEGRFVEDGAHSLPDAMAIAVAADTFHRDLPADPLAAGRSLRVPDTFRAFPAEGVDSGRATEEELLPWPASLANRTARLPMERVQPDAVSVFEDQPLSWCEQQEVQAEQHLFGAYASAASGEDRVETDDPRGVGVDSLLQPDWSVAEPASFAAMPARDGEANLWLPKAEPLSFAPWRQLGSTCGAHGDAYGVRGDRVMAPGGDLALDLGGTRADFYGGSPQEVSWWLPPVDNGCAASKDGTVWQQHRQPVGRRSPSPTRSSHISTMLGYRGISAATPPIYALFSSGVPRESPTAPAFPWVLADDGEGGEGLSGGGRDGERIFFGRVSSPLMPRYSHGGPLGSSCGRYGGDGGIGAFLPAQVLPPCVGVPFLSAESVSGNTTAAAAAPASCHLGRAVRQRLGHRDGARAPRALNGTTERCRRFWERCRQSMPSL
ncbi:hypothetical protein LSCM1_04197 [Leishmania martiniquensis]|uniref:Uncharacterized protein n=1 Tax=Leishmania martiniquensis TaxID=1580590 RepID=A0A836HGN3_9TRYP|nr:hypothetical protein LSCM1_04197 [Leishmania martiniquensis]